MGPYLVDCHIIRSNPSGELSEIRKERRNGIGNPLPDKRATSNNHEEPVSTHSPAVGRIYSTSTMQSVHYGASNKCCRPLYTSQ